MRDRIDSSANLACELLRSTLLSLVVGGALNRHDMTADNGLDLGRFQQTILLPPSLDVATDLIVARRNRTHSNHALDFADAVDLFTRSFGAQLVEIFMICVSAYAIPHGRLDRTFWSKSCAALTPAISSSDSPW